MNAVALVHVYIMKPYKDLTFLFSAKQNHLPLSVALGVLSLYIVVMSRSFLVTRTLYASALEGIIACTCCNKTQPISLQSACSCVGSGEDSKASTGSKSASNKRTNSFGRHSMGRYAQLVIGPAGSGKSTYCDHLRQHCETIGRTVHTVNLDPAAEEFAYPVSFDVRDLVTLEDVVEECGLGPNGGLLYCMEYLEENLDEWLGEELEGYGDDDYLVFDCPGQIELYSHATVFRTFVDWMKGQGWSLCAVYCLDCQFVMETPKFIAGSLQAMAAMVQLELPHVNVLTKADLIQDKKALDRFLIPDARQMAQELTEATGPGFFKLNRAVAQLLDDYSMVSFIPLDVSNDESIEEVLHHIDNAIQYGEDADVKIRDYEAPEGDDDM